MSGVGEVARTAEALVILCPDIEEQSVGMDLTVIIRGSGLVIIILSFEEVDGLIILMVGEDGLAI